MEALLAIAVPLAILLVFLFLIYQPRNPVRFPPGPSIRFPILGHLPLLGKMPYKTLLEWKATYGPVVGLWFGSHRVIAISDPQLLRQALSMRSLSGRPPIGFFAEVGGPALKGLVASEGVEYFEQRKFVMRQMKDYGFGSTSIESKIQDEILEILEKFKMGAGKPFVIQSETFGLPTLKIIWSFLMKEPVRLSEDKALIRTLELATRILKDNTATIGLSMFFPWIYNVALYLTGQSKFSKSIKDLQKFLKERIETHNASRKDTPRDFVDAYMNKVGRTRDPASSFHPSHNTIVYVVQDLFFGASETVSNCLSWLFLYMVTWPEIQTKLQEEIDMAVGHGRNPSLTDRAHMPYTVAVIYEMLRYSTVLPLGGIRRATEDVEFLGYLIPKGTLVLSNLYAANFDKDIWGDPQNFRPERFLDSSHNCVQGQEKVMTFSVGKRSCPGESIALDELFLFVTHLFQIFKARSLGKFPGFEGSYGVTVTVLPFKIMLEIRAVSE